MFSDDLERYYLRNPQGVINMTTAGVQIQINFAGKQFLQMITLRSYLGGTTLGYF